MRKLLSIFLIIATLIPLVAIPSFADESDFPDLSHTRNVYLYNLSADTVLYEKNSTEVIAPGPAVKLLTAAVAIDILGGDLNRVITIKGEQIEEVYGNNINLQDGEELTVLQLLNALIVGNANDAAVVLACEAAGSIGAFVLKMNDLAKKIGATNTFFSNPTGLEEGDMMTTAQDLAKLAIYISKYDIFNEISKKEYFIIPKTNMSNQRKIFNKNFFINTESESKYYSPYVTGMTAGSTTKAGQCVIASATNNNTKFICIVMGSDKDDDYIYSFRDCGNLLNWAYTSFEYKTVLSSSQVICTVPVKLSSETNELAVMPADSIDLFLNKNTDLDTEIKVNWNLDVRELYAPIKEGLVVGSISVLYKNEIVGQTNLVTKADVAQSELLYFKYRIDTFVNSSAFKWVVSLLVIIILVGLVYLLIKRKKAYDEIRRKRLNKKRNKLM